MRETKQVRILDTMGGFSIVYVASHMPVFRNNTFNTYWQALARIDEYHKWAAREYDLVCEPNAYSCLPDKWEAKGLEDRGLYYRTHGCDDYRTVQYQPLTIVDTREQIMDITD